MTDFCSGGASEQIPGTSDTVLLTSAVLASILGSSGLAWLEPFIGYFAGVITLNLPTFCAVDPPEDPGVSATDLLQLVALGPGPLTQGATDRVQQLVKRFAWSYFCQCSSIPTPPPPTPPDPPVGIPVINPPQTGGGTIQPCQHWSASKVGYPAGSSPENPFNNFSEDIFTNFTPLPAGATVITFNTSYSTGTDLGEEMIFDVFFYDANGVAGQIQVGDQVEWSLFAGQDDTRQIAVPAGAFYLEFQVLKSLSGGAETFGTLLITADAFCGGVPGSTINACCPPDPIATAKLDSIMQLLTLIQRQGVPFAYVNGPVHSGLTGTGVFDVAGILGILCNSSIPDRAGREDGTPVTLFDIGWINFASEDGYTERFFLASDSQLIIPRAPGIYTHVGYSLAPDVTVTITELVREP